MNSPKHDSKSGYPLASGPSPLAPAFTLVELLVVIAIIPVLAAMLLPVLGKAKQKAQGIQCMSNHRQLALAWRMYLDDNNEVLPYAQFGKAWVTGQLDFSGGNPSNWDPEVDLAKSPLWPYCERAAGIFKCPADNSVVRPTFGRFKGRTVSRVRSMAMNLWVGGNGPTGDISWEAPSWRVYRRLSDLVDPGPTMTWVFLDMREDSVNTGGCSIGMIGFPDRPREAGWGTDWPASYHHRAGGFSFADGHSEMHRWVDPRTMPPVVKGGNSLFWKGWTPSPNNRDIFWLQEHCTRRK
ncbi:MAG TPA: type II secretion system protein [Verrucomicrobiota bacterium]|nr:hypothetical protein [Verrucomicrobiales bacterium]HRI14800.1 type II secretion system protein [Verrucomicrobiota bacterium]